MYNALAPKFTPPYPATLMKPTKRVISCTLQPDIAPFPDMTTGPGRPPLPRCLTTKPGLPTVVLFTVAESRLIFASSVSDCVCEPVLSFPRSLINRLCSFFFTNYFLTMFPSHTIFSTCDPLASYRYGGTRFNRTYGRHKPVHSPIYTNNRYSCLKTACCQPLHGGHLNLHLFPSSPNRVKPIDT